MLAHVKPSRAQLADSALRAATELGIMLRAHDGAKVEYVIQFRDALHETTSDWLNEEIGVTDALTARLYFDALEKTQGSSAKSVNEFFAGVRTVVGRFDEFDPERARRETLQEMMKFALALHTLLISDAYSQLSHWKHSELY